MSYDKNVFKISIRISNNASANLKEIHESKGPESVFLKNSHNSKVQMDLPISNKIHHSMLCYMQNLLSELTCWNK